MVLGAAILLGGCGWIGLGWGALAYPTTAHGESANVVAGTTHAYASRGAAGIEIIDLAAPDRRRLLAPPAGASVDDLAIADGLLFALDAEPPGHLAVYTLQDPAAPQLLQSPVPVPVGPFSGVSAAAGLVAVSGGTSQLTLRRYLPDGRLDDEIATADLGRGQPDILLAPDGRHAYVSVHDEGPRFSLVVLELSREPLGLRVVAKLPLETWGFTPGGARPASFPIESALAGTLLLNASADGLRLVNVADPARPRTIAKLHSAALPVNVDARGGLAAVVGSDPEPLLMLVDISNPSAPMARATIRLPEGSLATGVALSPTQAIVAAHGAGTLVFPLDPINPQGS